MPASIVSQSYSQPAVLGPQTTLTIGNKVIAPDGFERATTLANGMFPGPLIAAQKHWHGILPEWDELCRRVLTGIIVTYSIQYPSDLAYVTSEYCNHAFRLSSVTRYHTVGPVLRQIIGVLANSTLINGLGRYAGGPASDLAVISVEQGKRYRMRLVAMSCNSQFLFSIDGHNFTVIEADGLLTEPVVVDSLTILAAQRYSVVFVADKPVDNYWMRRRPAGRPNHGQYVIPSFGRARLASSDQSLVFLAFLGTGTQISISTSGLPMTPDYSISIMSHYKPPTVPVLLQILSGAQEPSQLLPNGSIIVLEANKVVELTMSIISSPGGPHPIHLHGHAFDVVQSAGFSTFNYVNPVRRDVVSAGFPGEQMVIRWTTDNFWSVVLALPPRTVLDSGPKATSTGTLMRIGFAVVMAESPSDTAAHVDPVPRRSYLKTLGAAGNLSRQEAASITTLLYPASPLP
ncbi:laccase [Suillus subluteus]|nr:laccase [Suillus subluteus]